MSQSGKIFPNLDQNGTKLLNLTVLQRIDPSIDEILMTAAHVAFYEFNIDLNQWSRKDVEGSLFVVKRNAQPRFQFIVMNRRNTDNLIENISWDFEFELQVPYLLYRNASQEVSGIWFYNSRECEDVSNLFNRIISDYSKAPSQPKVPSSRSEFEDLEGAPSVPSFGGQMEPQSTPRTVTDVAEDSSFTNFFNVATNIGNTHSNMGNPGQPHHQSIVISTSSMASSLHSSSASPLQLPSNTAISAPVHHHDTPDQIRKSSQITNLVKPSTFFNPPGSSSSSAYMTPPISSVPAAQLQSSTMQRPYGAPLLQPFPPPNPPPSLTPSNTYIHGPVIDREKVRQALLLLAQDNQFIDMIHQALQKVHDT